MAGTLMADNPRAVITGPKESSPGELVILDASQSSGMGYLWLLVNSEKSFLPVDNGMKCVFSTGTPGTYHFVLVVSGTNPNGGPAAATAAHVLKIAGATPPGPDPPPNPPVPVPTPGKVSGAILLYESENTTQEMEQIILKLRADKIPHLKILDIHAKQADSDQPLKVVTDALAYLKGKPLPRLIALDSAGCSVADSDVATLEGVQRLLTSWGIK